MAPHASDPAARDGAGVSVRCREQAGHSKKPDVLQVSVPTFQRVAGDIGPVHLLGSPSASVIVERHQNKVLVWIESDPLGYGLRLREFLDPASPKIEQYARLQCLKLRKLALAEQDRCERLTALRMREWEAPYLAPGK